MSEIFPPPIVALLPQADIPLDGIRAYLSQSANHQILFMEFSADAELAAHSHAAQVGFVIEGRIDLVVEGEMRTYRKGDRYYIPEGAVHSGKIHKGYADITFFAEPKRYSAKGEQP
jgi:quercetin dioxygenase-like cupin family protein